MSTIKCNEGVEGRAASLCFFRCGSPLAAAARPAHNGGPMLLSSIEWFWYTLSICFAVGAIIGLVVGVIVSTRVSVLDMVLGGTAFVVVLLASAAIVSHRFLSPELVFGPAFGFAFVAAVALPGSLHYLRRGSRRR